MSLPVIYIAGKFRGPTAWDVEQNIRAAENQGFAVAEQGVAPLIPHANTRYFDKTLTEQFWLDATMALLRKCDAVMTVWNWESSVGAVQEVKEAQRLGIPVFHSFSKFVDWLKEQQR